MNDLTGRRYGRLTVIGDSGQRKNGSVLWSCQCECGGTVAVRGADLKSGKTRSCGCIKREVMRRRHADALSDIISRRFGRLIVHGRTDKTDNAGHSYYRCACDCGKVIDVLATNLLTGNTTSCGCLSKEINSQLIAENVGMVEGTNVAKISKRTISRNNTSGVRGVSWHKRTQMWTAYIIFKRKRYNLGHFSKLEDAARARREAEGRIFDEFLEWYYEQHPDKRRS